MSCLGETQDKAGNRIQTTSTPPAWHFLHECDVPATVNELSIQARKVPLADALCIQNDSPDPTYQGCRPSEQYLSDGPFYDSDQCSECRCPPGRPHATGCDGAAQVTDSVSNACPEMTAESCPECGTVTDIGYGTVKDKPPECQAYGEPEPARSAIGAGPLFMDTAGHAATASNRLLDSMECTFNSCMDIAVAKNEGYAGSADPMANLKDSVRLGVPVPIGVAIRLSDKWARLCRLLQTGENPLSDESITDTIMDSINYLAILLYALEDEA